MTARVALIGAPLHRRHSEVMHNAAFDHFGIDARYELRPMPAYQLGSFFVEARGRDWLGFQVTTPHKVAAMAHVDDVEPEARAIGAINSGLRSAEGRLVGFNTDSHGFARSVREDLGLGLDGARVVVAGAGGAARAIVHACLSGGAARIHIGNRTAERASELVADMGDGRLEGGGLDHSFASALRGADLAVNTTTVGMINPGLAFDVGLLPRTAKVLDLIYVPEATELVMAARQRGLTAANGIGMLVGQAAIAFERWTGVPGAETVMRRSIERLAEGRDDGGNA
jgi:shikimate dehydrogenase